jgi:phage terminase large subunit GpA-like protein
MDVLSPEHPAREIDVCKATQIGGSEVAINAVGYYSHLQPCSGLIVLPSKDVAGEWSRVRFQGLFEATPVLTPLIAHEQNRRRARTSTIYAKRLTNGATWKMAWSSSSRILRSTPASIIIADEVDAFAAQVGSEGEPIDLLSKRFANFRRGKFLRISSPVDRTGSRIERGFRDGDQRFYFVRCQHCGRFQRLIFERLRWPQGDLRTRTERTAQAAYLCINCEERIEERSKTDLLAGGMWIATRERPDLLAGGFDESNLAADLEPILFAMQKEKHPSFHLNGLYSPIGWLSWSQIAIDWERAQGDPERLKVFCMTTLAESWIDRGEAPDWERLFARRETYEIGKIPPGVLFLTAGVDVQANRLELEIVGWGRNRESWSIDYMVLLGDTEGDQPWRMLDEVLAREWPLTAGGTLPITVMGIDSGFRSHKVYEFCARHARPAHGPAGSRIHAHRTVQSTKGALAWDRLITHISTADAARHRGDLRIVEIGTGYAKQQLFDCLRLPVPSAGESVPSGFCHFPNFEPDFFRGLCSESRVIRASGKPEWVRDLAVRNEPLDCRIIARTMAGLYGMDRFSEEGWLRLEQSVQNATAPAAPAPVPGQQQQAAAQPRKDPFYVDERRASAWIERRPNWLDRHR